MTEPAPKISWSESDGKWYVTTYALGVFGPFDTEEEAEAMADRFVLK